MYTRYHQFQLSFIIPSTFPPTRNNHLGIVHTEKYPKQGKGFLLQISLYFALQPGMTETEKVAESLSSSGTLSSGHWQCGKPKT